MKETQNGGDLNSNEESKTAEFKNSNEIRLNIGISDCIQEISKTQNDGKIHIKVTNS